MLLDYNVLLDKTYGTFVGKTIGGVLGAPFEAHKCWGDFNDADKLWPDTLYPNDDLDIQLVYLDMMLETGPKVTFEKIAKYWRQRCWYNFCEYGSFLNNEQRGIHAPLSGKLNNSFWREDQGCPIRAEIFGVTSPCNINLASEYARIDGSCDHIEESIYAEMFWAASTSYAYVSDNLDEIFSKAIEVIPQNCHICKIYYEIKELMTLDKSLKSIWREIVRLYGSEDFSDARMNFACALIILFYSNLDIKKAVLCSINLGWDVDCTCGIACALIGTILGCHKLPAEWKNRIGDKLTCDVNSTFKDKTILEFSKACCEVAIENSLTLSDVHIVNVPQSILEKVKDRLKNRPSEPKITFKTDYGHNFVLSENGASLNVIISNNSDELINGTLNLESDLILSFNKLDIQILPFSEISLNIDVYAKDNIIWNKNLINLSLKCDNDEIYNYTIGVIGSHIWNVYGPYWDIYNKKSFDICPFRNDKVNMNPCGGPGDSQFGMFHNWVFLDEEYLDEKRLLFEEISEEEPFEINVAEDIIRNEDIDIRMNETVLYLTSNIVFDKKTVCNMFVGANSPFVLYIDGKKIVECNKYGSYAPHDNLITNLEFDTNPKRFVLKILKPNEAFKFGMQFTLTDWAGDKQKGISYILDNYGFVLN